MMQVILFLLLLGFKYVGGATYLGCYKDAEVRDLGKISTHSDDMDISKCVQFCKDYRFAGLQNSDGCFCGDSVGEYGKGEESDCNMNCSGNNHQICGGFWRNSVYELQSTICSAPDSLSKLKENCNENNYCTVHANNIVFGDPCPNKLKYVEMTYLCHIPGISDALTKILIFGSFSDQVLDDGIAVQAFLGLYKPVSTSNDRLKQTYPDWIQPTHSIVAISDGTWVLEVEGKISSSVQIVPKNGSLAPSAGSLIRINKNGSYIPADNLQIINIEGLSFQLFGGGQYAYLPFNRTYFEAQKICQSLDGAIAWPLSNLALQFVRSLPPTVNTSLWTGFHRNETSESWKWMVNDGGGHWFETDEDFKVNGSGCVIVDHDGALKAISCDDEERTFVCQTKQTVFYKRSWVRSYSLRRKQEYIKEACQSSSGIWRGISYIRDVVSFLGRLIDVHEYWTDYRRDPSTGKFPEVRKELWDLDEPSDNGDCVVYNIAKGYRTANCEESKAFFCVYFSKVSEYAFTYNGMWYWIPSMTESFKMAEETCSSHGHELATLHNEDDFYEIVKELNSFVSGDEIFWIKLGPNVLVQNGFITLSSNVELNSNNLSGCIMMYLDAVPRFQPIDCNQKARFICINRDYYKINPPNEVNYCPEGYKNIAGVTCAKHLAIPVSWPVAYQTCNLHHGGSLFQISDVINNEKNNLLPLLYSYHKLEGLQSFWGGVCGKEDNISDPIVDVDHLISSWPSQVPKGHCAVYFTNDTSLQVLIQSWKRSWPFTCIVMPREKESHFQSNVSLVTVMISNWLMMSPCGEEITSFKEICLDVKQFSWNQGCSHGNLINAYSPLIDSKIRIIMDAYRWVLDNRSWIGLETFGEQLNWNDQNNEQENISLWEDKWADSAVEGRRCVSVDSNGSWRREECDAYLPSLCRIDIPEQISTTSSSETNQTTTSYSTTSSPETNQTTTSYSTTSSPETNQTTTSYSTTSSPETNQTTTSYSTTSSPETNQITTSYSTTSSPETNQTTTSYSTTSSPETNQTTTSYSTTSSPETNQITTSYSTTSSPETNQTTTSYSTTSSPEANQTTTSYSTTSSPETNQTTTSYSTTSSPEANQTTLRSTTSSTEAPHPLQTLAYKFDYNSVDKLHRFFDNTITTETAIINWLANAPCLHYKIKIQNVTAITGSRDTDSCDTFDPNNYAPTTIPCQAFKRSSVRYQTNITLPFTGCVYTIGLHLSTSSNHSHLEKLFEYSRPMELTSPQQLRSQSLGHLKVSVSWAQPDSAELIDRYKVSLTRAETNHYVASFIIPYTTGGILTTTEPGFYNLTVAPMRLGDLGKQDSILFWSLQTNDSFSWSKWSSFSNCSGSCGNSVRVRQRFCLGPDQVQTDGCDGEATQVEREACSLQPCAIEAEWGEWSPYSQCSASCGSAGFKTRERECIANFTQTGLCSGSKKDTIGCPNAPCPRLSSWSAWSTLYRCSASCGNGTSLLTRTCLQTSPSEPSCVGNATASLPCSSSSCPVDGTWGEWGGWQPEMKPFCGTGNSTRSRFCDFPAPSHGGKRCDGSDANETQETRLSVGEIPCPGDYIWGEWGKFSDCSATCGSSALRTRKRRCIWREEAFRDVECSDDEEQETFYCGPLQCPVSGAWGEWGNWSSCSVSCGKGTMFRVRLCNSPKPSAHGDDCPLTTSGSQLDTKDCIATRCPANRYRASSSNAYFCAPEKSITTGLKWKEELVGLTQTLPCPSGSNGTASRKCLHSRFWAEEDLTGCVIKEFHNVLLSIQSSHPSVNIFDDAIKNITRILLLKQSLLRSPGDVIIIQKMIHSLLKWNPFSSFDVTRSRRLEHLSLITTAVDHLLQPRFSRFWAEMNTSIFLHTLKGLFEDIEDASLNSTHNLDPLFYRKYKLSSSRSFSSVLSTTFGWKENARFPEENDPETKFDQSYIELPSDVIKVNHDVHVRVVLTKYDFETFSSLPITSLPLKNNLSFEGKKLNSAMLGAQIWVDGEKQKEHRLSGYVYITFYHKRIAKDPVCVFVDTRMSGGFFNEDGCQVWRRRKDRTICRCNHVTTFALLSHDVITEEVHRRISTFQFKSVAGNTGYFCIGSLLIILLILFYPQAKTIQIDVTSVQLLLSCLIRHIIIELILWFATSELACVIFASCFIYTCVVNCSWYSLRCLDVYQQIVSSDILRRDSYTPCAWGLPLFGPLCALLPYVLYNPSQEKHKLECNDMFSMKLLLSSWVLCFYLFCLSMSILIYSTRSFIKLKSTKKPLIAYRNEKQIWMKGISLLLGSIVIGVTNLLLLDLATPPTALQVTYSTLVILEVIYFFFSELWLDHDLKSFYFQIFRASPPVEKVVYNPPKYIP